MQNAMQNGPDHRPHALALLTALPAGLNLRLPQHERLDDVDEGTVGPHFAERHIRYGDRNSASSATATSTIIERIGRQIIRQ